MKVPAKVNMAYLPHGKTSVEDLIEFPNERVDAYWVSEFGETFFDVAEKSDFKVPNEAVDSCSKYYINFYALSGELIAFIDTGKSFKHGESLSVLTMRMPDKTEDHTIHCPLPTVEPQKQGSKNFGFLFGLIACVIVVYLLFSRCTPEQLPCECTEYTMQLVQKPSCLQLDTVSVRTVYGCELHMTGGMEDGVIKQVKCK